MTKKMITVVMLSAFVLAGGSNAMAKSFKGEVTSISGTSITVKLSAKAVKKIEVGDSAKLSIKKAAKPSAGNSALTGC